MKIFNWVNITPCWFAKRNKNPSKGILNNQFKIQSYCHIKKGIVSHNGQPVFTDKSLGFSDFARSIYKFFDISYPKFFKMDNPSKLAFLASEILLREEVPVAFEKNIALVFSNNSSSLDTDRIHQKSIENQTDYYPSPAVFVYTLPNICLGEISIRHKLYSENSFFIFARFNAEHLHLYANGLLRNAKADKVLCGWVNFDTENYEAFLYLVGKEGTMDHNINEINNLYQIL